MLIIVIKKIELTVLAEIDLGMKQSTVLYIACG